jgi:thiol-disulfide isomerase/thioredoxin
MPRVDVKSLDGKMISAPSLLEGKPTVINFWATWCKPCVKELNAIQESLPDWEDEIDFTLIAISVDDSRSEHRVAPFVKGRAWEFDVYLDANSDLKRAMNASTVPHTFLFDSKGKLVWQHSGYNEGDEEELYEQLIALKEK